MLIVTAYIEKLDTEPMRERSDIKVDENVKNDYFDNGDSKNEGLVNIIIDSAVAFDRKISSSFTTQYYRVVIVSNSFSVYLS